MSEKHNSELNGLTRTSCKLIYEQIFVAVLFILSLSYVFINLRASGTMINASGDAEDIWKTITTFFTDDRYPSYVLYKGFASVFPYVWLYQLSLIFQTNDFFFVMFYHGVLFAYIAVIGVPFFVKALTGYSAKMWQRVLVVLVLYWYWDRYRVLSQVMVDLPSCAFFLLSIQCAVKSNDYSGVKKFFRLIIVGLLCGLCANISGQYSIAALCVLGYTIVMLLMGKDNMTKLNSNLYKAVCIFVLLLSMESVSALNNLFTRKVLDPFAAQGIYIASSEVWMNRALIYMIDIPRLFYGPLLFDGRGHEIVLDYYGAEIGEQMLMDAEAGIFGWTISEYFKIFLKYPVDFLMLYMNRVIIMMSDDMETSSLRSLLLQYTMIYLSAVTAVKRIRKLKDVFVANTLLILAVFASIIPVLVMTVEMRYTLSVQALLFGVALSGPIIPKMIELVSNEISQWVKNPHLNHFHEKKFPWELVGWIVFCFVCLAYFGAIAAGSDLGGRMLYQW